MKDEISDRFDRLFGETSVESKYHAERVVYEITEQIHQRMEEIGISRAELAERLNSGKPYVTKILRGNSNFTLQSLEKIAQALEFEGGVEVRFLGKQSDHPRRERGIKNSVVKGKRSLRSQRVARAVG